MVSHRVRFERQGGPGKHRRGHGYVELWREGNTLWRAWGPPDGQRQERFESFASHPEASAAYAQQVRRLEAKRYVAGRHHAELLGAIQREPDDAARYLVYADWLLERQDARGELITCMASDGDPSALLRQHEVQLAPAWWEGWLTASWRLGFLQRASCSENDPGRIRRLLRHPSAMTLEELHVEVHPTRSQATETWRAALEERPPTLRRISMRRHPALMELVGAVSGLVLVGGKK